MRKLYTPWLRIAPELWAIASVFALIAFTAYEGARWFWFGFWLLVTALVLRFGYGAHSRVMGKATGVMAPVDGIVKFRRECHDPFLGREAIRIGIAAKPFANYFLHAPVEGEVHALPDDPPQVSWVQTDEGDDIIIAVSKGWLFGAKPVWVPVGERVGQGKRCGVRRLAVWVDVYLPANARVEVRLQQAVKSGDTVLATLLRKSHG
jgi:phosphatidylserine decarboxylase